MNTSTTKVHWQAYFAEPTLNEFLQVVVIVAWQELCLSDLPSENDVTT